MLITQDLLATVLPVTTMLMLPVRMLPICQQQIYAMPVMKNARQTGRLCLQVR
jgi:hypothetical protein